MSVPTDIMDRLTNIRTLRVPVEGLVKEHSEMRGVVMRQQTDTAEVRGQLKALIQIQSQQKIAVRTSIQSEAMMLIALKNRHRLL